MVEEYVDTISNETDFIRCVTYSLFFTPEDTGTKQLTATYSTLVTLILTR